jgi:hypothetical protein
MKTYQSAQLLIFKQGTPDFIQTVVDGLQSLINGSIKGKSVVRRHGGLAPRVARHMFSHFVNKQRVES